VKIQATLLGGFPVLRQTGIGVRLVYYLWNQLFLAGERIGLFARNFCARNGICRSVDEEEGYQGPEGIDEIGDGRDIKEDEEDDSSTHDEGVWSALGSAIMVTLVTAVCRAQRRASRGETAESIGRGGRLW